MEKIKLFFTGDRTPAYTNKLPTQVLLICRAIVGGYLLYTDYTIINNLMNPAEQPSSDWELKLFIVCIVVFALFGLGLIYASIKNFMIGRYAGGKLDLGEKPSEGEENVYVVAEAETVEVDTDTSDIKDDEAETEAKSE